MSSYSDIDKQLLSFDSIFGWRVVNQGGPLLYVDVAFAFEIVMQLVPQAGFVIVGVDLDDPGARWLVAELHAPCAFLLGRADNIAAPEALVPVVLE